MIRGSTLGNLVYSNKKRKGTRAIVSYQVPEGVESLKNGVHNHIKRSLAVSAVRGER